MSKDKKQKVDETAAGDSLKTTPIASKSELLGMAMGYLAGMKPEDLSHFLNDTLASVGHEADMIPNGTAEKNQATIQCHGAAVKEDVEKLFEGSEVSEEFKAKAVVIFEAALSARVAVEREAIREEVEAQAQKDYDELARKVDDYLSYAVKEWVDQNRVAITSSVTTDLAKDFMEDLRKLFTEHFVEIPEEKVDVVQQMSERISELEGELNSLTEKTIAADKVATALTADKAFREVAEGLTLTDKEKFKTLVETVDFDGDVNKLKATLTTIKEQNFGDKPKAKSGLLNEGGEETVIKNGVVQNPTPADAPVLEPQMKAYVDALTRTIPQ